MMRMRQMSGNSTIQLDHFSLANQPRMVVRVASKRAARLDEVRDGDVQDPHGDGVPHGDGDESPAQSLRTESLVGQRVLVVDDVQTNLKVMDALLRIQGASITLATRGQEALDLLRMHPLGWDVVLMDIRMPGMDGFETTRRIRSDLGLTHLPIIACTGEPFSQIRSRLLEAGFDDFHPKPVDMDELIITVRRLIETTPSHQ
ncbi:MAG: response regulator [Sphingobacteriia bacterium]|nr:response regulator [Sphingobacteriia bacterium]NCC38932.1 response regulator [Gammaproteobacteria bacterium]